MNTQNLHELLSRISGHLVSESPEQIEEVARLHEHLSRSLLPEDVDQLKGTNFVFENVDLFAAETIPPERSAALHSIAENRIREAAEPEFRVFLREVPVRGVQVEASTPLWAAGAAVETTIGPLINKDGRQYWFDFYVIEKLVALYIQGKPDPALLFKVTNARFVEIGLPLTAKPASSYKLAAGSIWINSEILAANAPAGYFNGLTIKGGVVSLTAPPQLVNGKLTISANTRVTVSLQLQQPAVKNADAASPFGVDARNAKLQLPEKFVFHFSGAGSSLDEIAPAAWNVFGDEASFRWQEQRPAVYDKRLQHVLIPMTASVADFAIRDCESPFHKVRGQAPIASSAWALPAALIDILNPTQAAGSGALLVKCRKGLRNRWRGLRGGELQLNFPCVMTTPGHIVIFDRAAGNLFCQQTFNLWRDKQNPHGTAVRLQYPQATPFVYHTVAAGDELLTVLSNADVQIDRPVNVAGEAPAIRTKSSLLVLAASKKQLLIFLLDDNILFDNEDPTTKQPSHPQPIALALHNALFKVTPVNGCLLFGRLAEDFVKVKSGFIYLTFGVYEYLPTLPDPYAAKLQSLGRVFRNRNVEGASYREQSVWLWLVCQLRWRPANAEEDKVGVAFHFGPLQTQFTLQSTGDSLESVDATGLGPFTHNSDQAPADSQQNPDRMAEFRALSRFDPPLPDYVGRWSATAGILSQEAFALLDVSTNADLFGISFGLFDGRLLTLIRTHEPARSTRQNTSAFPLRARGMDVVCEASNVRAFTLPLISWEPVFNLTAPAITGDPDSGFNYYPDDGEPARLINASQEEVALAPIPLTDFIVNSFARDDRFLALALFTLPFGLNALTWLQNQYPGHQGTSVTFKPKSFKNRVSTSRQLEIHGGAPPKEGQSSMFTGATAQLNNIRDLAGNPTGNSTLGASVTRVFNGQFFDPGIMNESGVPLSRIDISGYGASIFSNWLNTKAPIASTSQAKFDVFVGRCAHEVIQVKSLLYPWGIKVVRTITLFRTASGYDYRYDSGWKAESDGRFDFSYLAYRDLPDPKPSVERNAPYEIHPGIISGLINVRDIKETEEVAKFTGDMFFTAGETVVNGEGVEQPSDGTPLPFELQPVFFNADVEIENPISGYTSLQVNGLEKRYVASKRILGFVQIKPLGQPLTVRAFAELIKSQQGSIGGPIDCVVDIGKSGQQMRLSRFDVSNSFGANGFAQIFVVGGRGNVILPKDGSWSMVRHEQGSGEVSPVPEDLSVPVIRIGKLVKVGGVLTLDKDPKKELLRVANPTELLRPAVGSTINYGFLHSTDTQKALFLTPSFALGMTQLLSKTPPLFVDAFRIVNSKAIFPNIGNAINSFGDAISLFTKGTEFAQNALTDGGTQVLELMKINNVVGGVTEQGYKLLKKFTEFDLPQGAGWTLIDVGAFKIYIEYKAQVSGSANPPAGKLNFDVDSFSANVADKWKSRMSNVGLVVDLGPIKRLMTIKGNWDAKKGAEAQYRGSDSDPALPSPQIEFAPELKPVMDILQILQDLQGENYKDAFQKGLKLAMSNKAGSWEYKFEASKEIPVVRFPPGFAYNDPNAPLKLEAGLKLGAYFNAALKVTTDPKQLLPTAGGFLGFYGKLSVMCLSVSIATVYAVGQVNLDIAADTKVGPSLRMKFGFGAQLVVGLPVVGNVSVLYMVGVEIYTDSTTLIVSAFLLFQGHAELLGGLVSVTITIEAKGSVSRSGDRTDLAAQVTFGLDISIFLIIDISFSTSWQEQRQIA